MFQPVEKIDAADVDPMFCCFAFPMRMAIFMIIIFEIGTIIYSIVDIALKSGIPANMEEKLGKRYRSDAEWLYVLRVLFCVAMYILFIAVAILYFGKYLATQGDGLRDGPLDRKPLVRAMDFILFKTVAEPIVLMISNAIIADYMEQEVFYSDI